MGYFLLGNLSTAALSVGPPAYRNILGYGGSSSATESQLQITYRVAGRFDRLGGHVNNVGTARSMTLRKNGANGANTVSWTDTTDQTVTDTTHIDSVADGDTINVSFTWVTFPTWYSMYVRFLPDSGHAAMLAASVVNIGTAGFTQLHCGANVNASESTVAVAAQAAFTLTNFFARVWTNGASATQTYTARKNSADGNNTLSIGTGATGYFEDTTHSDSYAVSDTFCARMATAGAGNNTLILGGKFDFTTAASGHQACGRFPSTTYANNTFYFGLFGSGSAGTATEAQMQVTAQFPCILSRLWVRVGSNSVNATSTFRTRKNGANGNVSVSIGSTATGNFSDTTNSDNVHSTDAINFSCTTTGSGTMDIFGEVIKITPTDPQILTSEDLTAQPIYQYPVSLRNWDWEYNKNLVGLDRLPVGKQEYRLPEGHLPRFRPFGPELRTWDWEYNKNLVGKDIVPGKRVTELPYTPRPKPIEHPIALKLGTAQIQATFPPVGARFLDLWPKPPQYHVQLRTWTWTSYLNLGIVPQPPVRPFDWPLPKTPFYVPDLRFAKGRIPPPQTVPFSQFYWPLTPAPHYSVRLRSWTWDMPPGTKEPPFNQEYWPLTPAAKRASNLGTITASYNPNLVGKDVLPPGDQWTALWPKGRPYPVDLRTVTFNHALEAESLTPITEIHYLPFITYTGELTVR